MDQTNRNNQTNRNLSTEEQAKATADKAVAVPEEISTVESQRVENDAK